MLLIFKDPDLNAHLELICQQPYIEPLIQQLTTVQIQITDTEIQNAFTSPSHIQDLYVTYATCYNELINKLSTTHINIQSLTIDSHMSDSRALFIYENQEMRKKMKNEL